jgi:hypothetical protein
MRTCIECGSSRLKHAQFDYDYSSECGLAEVVISSAVRHECEDCTFVTVDLGKLDEIDKKLVTLICSQSSLLTGNQSRFLRLRLFDMDLKAFSELVEIDAATLDITENANHEHRFENSTKIRAIAAKKIASQSFTITFGSTSTKLDKG